MIGYLFSTGGEAVGSLEVPSYRGLGIRTTAGGESFRERKHRVSGCCRDGSAMGKCLTLVALLNDEARGLERATMESYARENAPNCKVCSDVAEGSVLSGNSGQWNEADACERSYHSGATRCLHSLSR